MDDDISDLDAKLDRLFQRNGEPYHFHLDEKGEPVASSGWKEWGKFMELEPHESKRIVKQEQIGPYWVSTVFLGMDHGWGSPVPVLWETMVFSGIDKDIDQTCDRCAGAREQAEAMHEVSALRCRILCATRDPVKDMAVKLWGSLHSWWERRGLQEVIKKFRASVAKVPEA